jgi:choline dehydrogenase-like flavoprotein
MTTTETFDAVVVGAGIAGAILARTLTHAGKTVLLLEAGAHEGLLPESYQTYLTNFYQALAKVPNSPYPANANAPSPDVIDVTQIASHGTNTAGYLVQKGPLSFGSDFLRAAGGTTLHWLGTTLRLLPNDFALRSTYGHGADWPVSYEEMRPYYEMAEREIGVSGDAGAFYFPGISSGYYGDGYCLPMHKIPQSYLDRQFIDGLGAARVESGGEAHDVKVVSTPQGRNSHPNRAYTLSGPAWDAPRAQLVMTKSARSTYEAAGAVGDPFSGQRCEGNASCVPICPVQAKYNALKTLRHLNRDRARIVTQAVASRIEIDPDTGRVTGITYKRYSSPDSSDYTVHTARGVVYAIAGNAIETAKLMLASGAARSSPDLGRNLMDHPVMLSWGLMPSDAGAFRGPGSTSHIASFRDGAFRARHAAFIMPIDNWGWGWPAFSPGSDVAAALERNLFGVRLREHLRATVSRQFSLHCEFEQLPEAANRVTIDPAYMDRLGNYRPVINYDLSVYTRAGMAAGRAIARQIFARLGAEDFTQYQTSDPGYVTYEGDGFAFRGAGHLIGTHRMGTNSGNSVVDRDQRSWEHDNLYLVGAGSMVSTGTCNPTLTVAALGFKASEQILKRLA